MFLVEIPGSALKLYLPKSLIGSSKQKVIKYNKRLGFCYGQTVIKIGKKTVVTNPIVI